MDAVDFIKERQRFCYGRNCDECGLRKRRIHCGSVNEINKPKALVDFIEQWAKEHPIVTNADKLVEVFGQIRLSDITPEWLKQEYREPEGKG